MASALSSNASNGGSFRSRAAEWLFQQGVSTVLLAFIGVGAWYGIPAAVGKLEKVLDRTAARHEKEVQGLSDTFERTLDRLQGKIPKNAAGQPQPPELEFNAWPGPAPLRRSDL